MRVSKFVVVASAILLQSSSALNILLGNDDSWASANIREFYKALKAAGHKVLLVAPAVNQSGKGGTVSFFASSQTYHMLITI
jgi:5'-nucleotidase